jgi:zinc D-Ala-D-Ala dipeptidase
MRAVLIAAALAAQGDFVALPDVAPTVQQDMRYAYSHNFVGRRIDGYRERVCLLTRPAAEALARVQADVERRGYTLKVYDCYRPQRAVNDFAGWAADPRADRMKAEFYPRVAKSRLFDEGYIARRSGHSRGSTVDLTLVKLPARRQPAWRRGQRLVSCLSARRFPDNSVDMGTGYDCFDTRAHTAARVGARARANRRRLVRAMAAQGFENYPNEWWHYTLADEPFPNRYFDFPVSRAALP